MYTPVYTKQFEKDTKRCVRRDKNMDKFKILVPALLAGKKNDTKKRERKKYGKNEGRGECKNEEEWEMKKRVEGRKMEKERMGKQYEQFKKRGEKKEKEEKREGRER